MQDAATHELLDTDRGLFLLDPSRPLKERELEFAADDRRDGRENLPALGQSLQTSADDLSNSLWDRES